MKSRGQDVDEFLKQVKELDEQTSKEDKDRLERIKSTSSYIPDESRFERMRERETTLRYERESKSQEIAPAKPVTEPVAKPAVKSTPKPLISSPPRLPKRPDPQPEEPKQKGFIASAYRHSGPEPEQKPILAASEPKKSPEKPKPSWISSAMSQRASEPEPSPPSPVRSHSSSPIRHLKPQNAGVDPKFASITVPKPRAAAKPAPKPRAQPAPEPAASRTPSQSLKDARAQLGKKTKPTLAAPPEDPIKEFREQLVLEPKQTKPATPQKSAKPQQKPLQKREPSVPEALRNRSLKPALAVRKITPPTAEAHERIKMLKPAKAIDPVAEETPEALQRMKTLAKTPKMQREAEPEPDALTKLRSLKPSKLVEKEPDPSPEAIERLHSLRKAKPKPVVEEKIPEAIEKRGSLRSPTKPQLQRSPQTTLRQTASVNDFRSRLNAAIANPPKEDNTGPLRRAKTDITEPEAPLEHLTKSRPRGPKRKLPSAAKSSGKSTPKAEFNTAGKENELELPKRSSLKPKPASTISPAAGRSFSRDELRRLASAKRKPKVAT